MSKPKLARDRLFKHGKPNIRPFEKEDLGILWAAYKKGAMGYLGDLTQDEFTESVLSILSRHHWAWVIEDKNHHFSDKTGPIGLMVAKFNGWEMEPHYLPFPWATPRNSVKAVVGFMMMARYEKGVGILNVFSRENDKDFFRHLGKRYGVMYFVGKIPRGDYGEDRYVFYGRGGSYFKGMKHELHH